VITAHSRRLQLLISTGENNRLHIAKGLPAGKVFARELQAFRVGISASGRTAYGATAGEHDDLVLAVALVVWQALL
jgi:hypothetical protein